MARTVCRAQRRPASQRALIQPAADEAQSFAPSSRTCPAIGAAALLVLTLSTTAMSSHGTEEPEYQVVRTFSDGQVRRYAAYAAAEVVAAGPSGEARGQASSRAQASRCSRWLKRSKSTRPICSALPKYSFPLRRTSQQPPSRPRLRVDREERRLCKWRIRVVERARPGDAQTEVERGCRLVRRLSRAKCRDDHELGCVLEGCEGRGMRSIT
jgi:hypothetical protein